MTRKTIQKVRSPKAGKGKKGKGQGKGKREEEEEEEEDYDVTKAGDEQDDNTDKAYWKGKKRSKEYILAQLIKYYGFKPTKYEYNKLKKGPKDNLIKLIMAKVSEVSTPKVATLTARKKLKQKKNKPTV